MSRRSYVYLCINARLKNGVTPKDVHAFINKAFGLIPVKLCCMDRVPGDLEFENVITYERKERYE